MTCCICGEAIREEKHNANPLAKGWCCDSCNKQVLKYRIMEMGLCMVLAEEIQSNIEKEMENAK